MSKQPPFLWGISDTVQIQSTSWTRVEYSPILATFSYLRGGWQVVTDYSTINSKAPQQGHRLCVRTHEQSLSIPNSDISKNNALAAPNLDKNIGAVCAKSGTSTPRQSNEIRFVGVWISFPRQNSSGEGGGTPTKRILCQPAFLGNLRCSCFILAGATAETAVKGGSRCGQSNFQQKGLSSFMEVLQWRPFLFQPIHKHVAIDPAFQSHRNPYGAWSTTFAGYAIVVSLT